MSYFIRVFFYTLIVISTFFPNITFAQNEIQKCYDYYKTQDYQRAIDIGKIAVKKYPKNTYSHLCLGVSYFKKGELNNALYSLKQAEKLTSNKYDIMEISNLIGQIYDRKDDHDNAIYYYNKSLIISKELNDKKHEAIALGNLAGIYYQKNELEKALEYYQEVESIYDNEEDKNSIYNNIALIYVEKGEYQKALEYFTKSLDLNNRSGNYHEAAKVMLNMGSNYIRMDNLTKAEEYLNEGLKRILKIGDKYWEAVAYEYFSLFYIKKKNYASAKDYAYRAYNIYNSVGAQEKANDMLLGILLIDFIKDKTYHAGIEIGAKGVKGMVAEIIPADKEGFYNINEKLRKTINTTIISGVKEKGEFEADSVEETAVAVSKILDEILKVEGVKKDEVVILGSSALYNVKNKDFLAKKIKEKTGIEMNFIDKEQEIFYGIIGSIPKKHQFSSILIDIGSGNTKIGFIESDPLRLVSFEIPFGTVSLSEAAKKNADKVYINELESIVTKEIVTKLTSQSAKKPALLNRKPVFLVGGIVWAMSTILYPEKQDSFTRLKVSDIDKFYNLCLTQKDKIFDIDLSKIKDEELKKKAEKQIKSVQDVFTVDNLIAGATILKNISKSLKLGNKEIYFSRNGNWLWGYIMEHGMEKAEKSLMKK